MHLDCTFGGAYEFAAAEWPGGSQNRMFWYPGASTVGGRDGVILSITPAEAPSWLGVFEAQQGSSSGVNGAVALPDRKTLGVLSNGAVYLVAADDPLRWDVPLGGGVMSDPIIVHDLELVLFVEHTRVSAYGRNGPMWHTERLVWDDLQFLRLDGDELQLKGFDAPRNEIVSFSLDLLTGRSPDAPHPDRRLHRVS
jgi:hypothetical protein